MARLYKVSFDTQRDRQYISWEYIVPASSQKEAKAKAVEHWHSPQNPKYLHAQKKPHMFHISAERTESDKEPLVFCIVKHRFANWG